MQSGSPHARYALLIESRVEQIALAYDHGSAARRARDNGREDWATALDSGFAIPLKAGPGYAPVTAS